MANKGQPRAASGKYKKTSSAKGHTFGECSKKRALIKQRVHELQSRLTVTEELLVVVLNDLAMHEVLLKELSAQPSPKRAAAQSRINDFVEEPEERD